MKRTGSGPSRRAFLAASLTGVSSAWIAANWPGILAAGAYAQDAVNFTVLSHDDALEIDAVSSQIIPTDDTPGAHEARVVYFIDRALMTFARANHAAYTQGLTDLQAKTREMFPAAAKFSALTSAQQIQLLASIETTSFFRLIRNHTVMGMFASPEQGGNHDKAGWQLIGFEDTLNFKPPFGYYDKPKP